LVIDVSIIAISRVEWRDAVRIVRSRFPPIDLFEDIADPADWPLLLSAEQKTNPRLMESIGNLDLVPPARRVGGPGASWLMAPFVHVSSDRPSCFSRGRFGVLYAGREFETALLETVRHHARFMARTKEPPGWTSQFREILLVIDGRLHDLRGNEPGHAGALDSDDYGEAQALGEQLRGGASDGIVYPSVRRPSGECVGLFYPDLAFNPRQGRHLDYYWDGTRVDLFREPGSGSVYRIA
jgi:RES domain-containing protein